MKLNRRKQSARDIMLKLVLCYFNFFSYVNNFLDFWYN